MTTRHHLEHYHAAPLLEALEKNPDNLEDLVDHFLWVVRTACFGVEAEAGRQREERVEL